MGRLKVPYLRVYKGKKRASYYFSPPAYVVNEVYAATKTRLKGCKLSDSCTDAINECLDIYTYKIKPYLRRKYTSGTPKQTFSYIWAKFCERRGIGRKAAGPALLERPLAEQTKKDYMRAYAYIEKVKNKSGKSLAEINADLILPQTVEKIYLQLYDLAKERWARNCRDLLRLLFNYGKHRLGVLTSNNPFEGLAIPKTKRVQPLWTKADVEKFNAAAVTMGEYEVGLAVRLNFYLGQRPADFLRINMSQLKTLNGRHYFEIHPNKTEKYQIVSFAPLPDDLYNEIKDRTGKLVSFNTLSTLANHFLAVKKASGINEGLNFRLLRNSAATAYYEAGSSAAENMTILGHKQINTNMAIYRQNTPEQALNALEKRLNKKD